MRKNEPVKAVEEVEEWKEKSLKERGRKAEEKEKKRQERMEKAQVRAREIKEILATSDGVEQGAEVLVMDAAKKIGAGSAETDAKDGVTAAGKVTTS